MKQRFQNGEKLVLQTYNYEDEIKSLDLSAFPPVNDFTVDLRDTGEFGQHIGFNSETLGPLAGFPWWDNVERDLPTYDSTRIPLGTYDQPFDDCEQSWQIVIFENAGYVYIMQGDDPCCTEFATWFRVERNHYVNEWLRLIRKFNPAA
ncbi:MAG TPA: hypothetical protein VK615_07010 [Candidatus Binatia bacterium]|nr:hypothetical protein [Candidatus Binatia bacterium]